MSEEVELFGTIALKSELITQPQLARALADQEAQRGEDRKRIGQILAEQRALKPVDVQHILEVQALMRVDEPETQFAVIAFLNNYVTRVQAQECIDIFHRQRARDEIGDLMVKRGLLSEKQKEGILRGIARLNPRGGGKPRSRLVQAIRRIDEGGAHTGQQEALSGLRFEEARSFIKDCVHSMIHLGILSHITHKQSDAYTVRGLVKVLNEDKKAIRDALADLVNGGVLVQSRGLLGESFLLCPDPRVRQRVEMLMSMVDNPRTKGDIYRMLMGV